MTSMAETNLAYREGEHPVHGTWLSVDVVAFTEDVDEARVVLIRRRGEPHRGTTTLPGGLLAAWHGETVEQAARRVVAEKAGTEIIGGVVPVGVVSDPSRDERGHTVSVVVAARVPAGVSGAVLASDIPEDMPFGHTRLVRDALLTINGRLLTDPELTHALLGDETTFPRVLALLRACGPVTESAARARWGRSPLYQPTARMAAGGRKAGRPTSIYRWSA